MVFISMPSTNKEVGRKIGLFLRAEMKRRNISSKELCKKLDELGMPEKPLNINNKISRGTFSAVFLVQCLKAIGYEKWDIDKA